MYSDRELAPAGGGGAAPDRRGSSQQRIPGHRPGVAAAGPGQADPGGSCALPHQGLQRAGRVHPDLQEDPRPLSGQEWRGGGGSQVQQAALRLQVEEEEKVSSCQEGGSTKEG